MFRRRGASPPWPPPSPSSPAAVRCRVAIRRLSPPPPTHPPTLTHPPSHPPTPTADKKTNNQEGGYAPAKTSSAIVSGCLSAAIKKAEKEYASVTKGCTKIGLVDTKAGPVCSQVVEGINYVFNFKILCQKSTQLFQAKCYDKMGASKIDSVVYGTAP